MLLLSQFLNSCITYFPLPSRSFGQTVTKLAALFISAIPLKIFPDFSEQHILFVTMGQRKLIMALGGGGGVFFKYPITGLVSDANKHRSSCNEFQKQLHPRVTSPRETSPGHLEQKLLDIATAAENPFLKKQVTKS